MTVSARESLAILSTCEIFSRRNGICSQSEPDDSTDLYIDFLEKLNPYDWINDFYLLGLIDNLFHRKKKAEEQW